VKQWICLLGQCFVLLLWVAEDDVYLLISDMLAKLSWIPKSGKRKRIQNGPYRFTIFSPVAIPEKRTKNG